MIKRNVAMSICTIAIALSTLGACGGGDDDDKSGGASGSGSGGSASAPTGSGGDSNNGSAGMAGGNAGDSNSNSSSSTAPKTECTTDHDCGISFECVACGLTDTAGWCAPTKECMFDDDCAPDRCGYNVVTSDYRCLPAKYCPD